MPAGRVGRVGDGNGPREWLEALPPITRAWFLSSLATTTLTSFGVLNPYRVVWAWPLVWRQLELWRVATPFAFFGGFSLGFLINMYVLVQYSRNYEVAPYNTGGGGSTADYAWMLGMGAVLLLAMCTFLGESAPAQGLTYYVMYVWSRRNPTTPVSLYGLQLQAVYLPWALLAFNLIIGNPLTMPIMGVVAGHVYYFLVDALPLRDGSPSLVRTPRFLVDLFHGPGSRSGGGYAATAPPGRRAEQQPQQRRPFGGGHNWGAGRQLGAE